MSGVRLLLLTLIYRTVCIDPCYNKPCECCRTKNCSPVNNTCENGCIDGYTGDNCYHTCPVNCVNCWQNNREICDTCRDGYHNGYWHDGGNSTWLENCSHKCRPQCKSCYRYRTCKECVDGFYINSTYGDCRLPCPPKCVSCLSESYCKECRPGFYGLDCSEVCGKGCNTPTCEKKTGWCNCTDNYTGVRCDNCKPGKYGKDCDLDCPNNCDRCDQSGMCLQCKQGYSGLHCTEKSTTNFVTSTSRVASPVSTMEANAGSPSKKNTVKTILGSVFGVFSVGLILLTIILCWRNRQKQEKVDMSASEDLKNETTRKLSEDSSKLDIEVEIYDEIPCYWSKPSEKDPEYMNPGFDDMSEVESPSMLVFQSGKDEFGNMDYASNNIEDDSDDSTRKDLKDEENVSDEDNTSNYSFASEPISREKKMAIETDRKSPNNYEKLLKTSDSFVSDKGDKCRDDSPDECRKEMKSFKYDIGGLLEDKGVASDGDHDRQRKDKDFQKPKNKLETKDDAGKEQKKGKDKSKLKLKYLTARDQHDEMRKIEEKGRQNNEKKRMNDYEDFSKTRRSCTPDNDTKREESYENFHSRKSSDTDEKDMKREKKYENSRDSSIKDDPDSDNDRQQKDKDFLKSKKDMMSKRDAGNEPKREKEESKLKLKYLTARDQYEEMHKVGEKRKQSKIVSSNENYEQLEKGKEPEKPKTGKHAVKYYDFKPSEGDSDTRKSGRDLISEHDYERLEKGKEIDQSEMALKPAGRKRKVEDRSQTRFPEMLRGVGEEKDYEKLRIRSDATTTVIEELADRDYINATYV